MQNVKKLHVFLLFLVVPFVLVSLLVAFFAYAQGGKTTAVATEPNLKVAFIANTAFATGYLSSEGLVNLIKDENADMIINSGNMDIFSDSGTSPLAVEFDNTITSILGESFPYFSSAGQYDEPRWADFQELLQARVDRIPEANCTGDLGVQSSCTYKGLFFTLIGDPFFDYQPTGTIPKKFFDSILKKRSERYSSFVANELANNNSIWSICSEPLWLLNDNSGTGVGGDLTYNACREGGGIVATGAKHAYLRTHLASLFHSVGGTEIVHTNSHLEIKGGKNGQTIAFNSGLGRPIQRNYEDNTDWLAINYNTTFVNGDLDFNVAENARSVGALFCTFNVNNDPKKAECYFKNVGGEIIDNFTMESQVR